MKDGGLAPPDEDSRESALERAKRARGNMRGTKTFAPQQVVQLETAPKKPKKVDVKKQAQLAQEEAAKAAYIA